MCCRKRHLFMNWGAEACQPLSLPSTFGGWKGSNFEHWFENTKFAGCWEHVGQNIPCTWAFNPQKCWILLPKLLIWAFSIYSVFFLGYLRNWHLPLAKLLDGPSFLPPHPPVVVGQLPEPFMDHCAAFPDDIPLFQYPSSGKLSPDKTANTNRLCACVHVRAHTNWGAVKQGAHLNTV